MNDNGTFSGAAYIFERSGSTWTQEAKLVPSDNQAADYFGYSVTIAGDYAGVGALGDDDVGSASGSIYIYWRNDSGNWVQVDKKTASDGAANDYFGFDMDMTSTDIIVGAHRNSDNGSHSGSAYIFHRSGSTWSEQAKLTASDASAKVSFGYSVGIHGGDAIVGAIGHDSAAANAGMVYVFTRSGSSWTEQDRFSSDDATAEDQFGNDVKIETDSAIIGAFMDETNGLRSGSAYHFTRSGGTWSQDRKLTAPSPYMLDDYGRRVGITNQYAIVGDSGNDNNGGNTGAVTSVVSATARCWCAIILKPSSSAVQHLMPHKNWKQ